MVDTSTRQRIHVDRKSRVIRYSIGHQTVWMIRFAGTWEEGKGWMLL